MFKFFSSDSYNFEVTRIPGSTNADGCEIAEFVEALSKTRLHDPESWHHAWNEQSRRLRKLAGKRSIAATSMRLERLFLGRQITPEHRAICSRGLERMDGSSRQPNGPYDYSERPSRTRIAE